MRVFRRRHTLGCVALVALAMQVALAFAHTHVHTKPSARESLAARAITFGLCRQSDERPCPRPPSAPHEDHAQCSICVAVSHAGAAVLDAAPGILLRHPAGDTPVSHRTAAQVDGTATVQFQARAPPCA
jgi:hypothetical protein